MVYLQERMGWVKCQTHKKTMTHPPKGEEDRTPRCIPPLEEGECNREMLSQGLKFGDGS